MAKDDQQEAYERLLSQTLARVIEFLKFAEAKNAALVTFGSAWAVGCINLLSRDVALSPLWQTCLSIGAALFLAAAMTALSSFIPKLSLEVFHKDPEQLKSLLYFDHIATFAPAAFRDRIRERYYPPKDDTASSRYLDDLSIQIAVNSSIAKTKFHRFNVGIWLALLGIVAVAVPVALSGIAQLLEYTN